MNRVIFYIIITLLTVIVIYIFYVILTWEINLFSDYIWPAYRTVLVFSVLIGILLSYLLEKKISNSK